MPAKNSGGIEIETIEEGGLAGKAGLLPGDRLVAVNGRRIRDAVDLMFQGGEREMKFLVNRGGEGKTFRTAGGESDGTGIVLKPFKVKTCVNNCIFCFVSQLPKGMRKTLYLKDDDYRMSFLFGSYITMTNLSDADRKRIVEQRLSPLYISVHASDKTVRNRMIGNQKARDIMKEIKFLAGKHIRMHTQIVMCPGVNDGKVLEKTITDLYRFFPYVLSIAVVPVGLTAHSKKPAPPLQKEDAMRALDIIHRLQSRFRRKHGESIVYGADELYIKAESDFPPVVEYGEFPQIENGVGMVARFLHQAKRIRLPQAPDEGKRKRFVTFTGMSFYPYLAKFVDKIRKSGIDIEALPVENTFFGASVTVAGLLTGRDVIKTLSGALKREDILLVPDVALRGGEEVFLDDVSVQDLGEVLGVNVVVVPSTPRGVADAVINEK